MISPRSLETVRWHQMLRPWTLLAGLLLGAITVLGAGSPAPALGSSPGNTRTTSTPDASPSPDPSANALSGVLQWRGLPPVRWTIETHSGSPLSSRVEGTAHVAAEGLEGTAHVIFDASSGESVWRDGSLRIDLARWVPPLLIAARLAPLPPGVAVTGSLTATTAGAWTRDGLTGRADLQVRGTLERATPPLRVDGIALSLTLPDLQDLAASPRQHARFDRAKIGDVVAENGEIRFRVRSLQEVSVEGADLRLLGGRVAVAPFSARIEPDGLAPLATTVTMESLALAEAIKLLPQAVTAATGLIAGSVDVQWSKAESVTIGRGLLELQPGRRAEMRLAPQPGFLTGQLPERLALLPPSFGPLARWFTPRNPAYAAVEAIELGRENLVIESLQILTRPEADDAGRTARLLVRARPAVPSAVGEVAFEVNLSGPLNQVLKLGLDERVQLPAAGALDPAARKRNIR